MSAYGFLPASLMPSLKPILGNTLLTHVFLSNKSGSGKRWQFWQYFKANAFPSNVLSIKELSVTSLYVSSVFRSPKSTKILRGMIADIKCLFFIIV